MKKMDARYQHQDGSRLAAFTPSQAFAGRVIGARQHGLAIEVDHGHFGYPNKPTILLRSFGFLWELCR
jgi:hypothetical protein